jgi:hypothetical protein
MRSHQGITDAITAFKACRGKVTARDAKTGEETPVEALEDRSDGMARLLVRLTGRQVVFAASSVNGPNGLGTYFNIRIHHPTPSDCEPTSIEILDNGHEDYEVFQHGSGSWGPTLALTLVNEGAEARNAPIIAAYEAERRRLQEERDRLATERIEAERQARIKAIKARADEISSHLVGKRVTRVGVESFSAEFVRSIELRLDDGTTLKIRARHDHAIEIERL